MTHQTIRVTHDGAVTIITIDQPEKRNAVDRTTAEELAEAFRQFNADEDAAVAVLTGAGGTFCAGADLKAIGTEKQNRTEPSGDGPMGLSRMRLSKPVIAAVEGHAVAGGLELAAWCSLRVAAEDAVFGVFCRRWGVPLIDGGTVRLPRLIGESRALDMILTGRAVGADEALAFGLANRVVPTGEALTHAVELAHRLSRFPQTCMRNDYRSVQHQTGHDIDDAMAYEFAIGMESLSADGVFGARRFSDGDGRHGSFAAVEAPSQPPGQHGTAQEHRPS